jgi:CRP-like cAMP-binding protein
MQSLFDQFNGYLTSFGFTKTELDKLNEMCEVVDFKKGEVIIRDGVIQKYFFFICNGLVRNFIVSNDGKIHTYNFRMENMLVTGYAPYNNIAYNQKSELTARVSVECLEPCNMIKVEIAALNYMVYNSSNGDRVGRLLSEAHVCELVDFIIESDTKTVLERYNDLDIKFPNIHQRVPQHIIASYLGTTAVHLSRIKNAKVGR